MNRSIPYGQRTGTVSVPSSKSAAHRLLICTALSKEKSVISCSGLSRDILATAGCLGRMTADIRIRDNRLIEISPFEKLPEALCSLDCGESGTTLRLLLPVAGALGLHASFHMADGLARRPMDPLISELTSHGVTITKEANRLITKGKLTAGDYTIPGSISSQFISGLLFALPLLQGDSTLTVTGQTESENYILMTEKVLIQSGIRFEKKDYVYRIPGDQQYRFNGDPNIEADWSGAAFFLCMGALSEKGITVNGLSLSSLHGDKEILNILRRFGARVTATETRVTVQKDRLSGITADARAIPDLIPAISALAACSEGTTQIINAGRLRFKESDRLKTTAAMLNALGADVKETPDGLIIHGKKELPGGTIDPANDHRIAMAATIAACVCRNGVYIPGAECADKSYPDFWDHLKTLEVF